MASITISNIFFVDRDPCQPRYPDFYLLPVGGDIPVQVEPAFQIGDGVNELSVQLELDAGSEVEFTLEGNHPLCWELNHGKVEVQGSLSSCTLIWQRDEKLPPTRVFRLYCQRKGTKLTNEQKVHGGLFLAFTTAPTGEMGRKIPPQNPPAPDYQDVVLMGSDEDYRPLYDVHRLEIVLPKKVEIEPAFRVREGCPLDFGMVMGILYGQWLEDLKFIQPETKPESLDCTFSPDEPTVYRFRWQQKPPRPCAEPKDCFTGQVVTFHLQPTLDESQNFDLEGWTPDEYQAALEKIGVDPTIIQPPPCDPFYQVCYQDGEEPVELEPNNA